VWSARITKSVFGVLRDRGGALRRTPKASSDVLVPFGITNNTLRGEATERRRRGRRTPKAFCKRSFLPILLVGARRIRLSEESTESSASSKGNLTCCWS
jgi:hypothetical protein